MAKERLNKYLAGAGIASRRKADELIEQGKVKINGKIITSLGVQIDPEKDQVEYQGQILQPATPLLFMFNKPPGVTSTMADQYADKTIADYFKDVGRVYPVGRLDRDSEGLLLVTNDGDLANELTHPRYEHEKEYEVTVKVGPNSDGDIARFSQSFKMDGSKIKPMRVKIINKISPNSWLISLVLQEGRKRQIRRVAEILGYKITKLKRVRMGKLKLGNLHGKYRRVLANEII